MSTRATILVKSDRYEIEHRLYHHTDGYPDGIGTELKEFLKPKKSWYASEIANGLVKGECADDDGYEITAGQHGDEEYAYIIDCDKKTLKCYSIGLNDEDWPKDEKEVEIPD